LYRKSLLMSFSVSMLFLFFLRGQAIIMTSVLTNFDSNLFSKNFSFIPHCFSFSTSWKFHTYCLDFACSSLFNDQCFGIMCWDQFKIYFVDHSFVLF
jgi:hypothetical protein